ncbi:MAG: helix-turn-helix transcriptional regulator [Chloroflexia bacterium]|nr:helix-turn-helix transcriptional regulator [Chloroflexia bacterium]
MSVTSPATITTASAFARLLEQYRTERRWSKADLAKRADLDPSTITRFEQGTRAPERETVLQIAEAMALPVVERDRLLAAAGFRSELWDDPLLVALAQVLGDSAVPAEVKGEVRTLLRMAIAYCGLHASRRDYRRGPFREDGSD